MDALATLLSGFRVRRAALAAIASLAIAASAHAHAFLDRASPAVGSTLEASPSAVTLEFTEEIEPSFSTLEVVDVETHTTVEGKPIERPKPTSMTMPLPQLAAGTYEVRWSVLSIDTHKTEGRFKFHVAPR